MSAAGEKKKQLATSTSLVQLSNFLQLILLFGSCLRLDAREQRKQTRRNWEALLLYLFGNQVHGHRLDMWRKSSDGIPCWCHNMSINAARSVRWPYLRSLVYGFIFGKFTFTLDCHTFRGSVSLHLSCCLPFCCVRGFIQVFLQMLQEVDLTPEGGLIYEKEQNSSNLFPRLLIY